MLTFEIRSKNVVIICRVISTTRLRSTSSGFRSALLLQRVSSHGVLEQLRRGVFCTDANLSKDRNMIFANKERRKR